MTDSDFHLITPNDIVLGRAARPRGRVPSWEDLEEPNVSLQSLSHMEQVARAWHNTFIRQAWPLLVSHQKWVDRKTNLVVGDVGFLLYTSKFGKPTWRACRVLELHPDRTGAVRTVTVGLRRHAVGEGATSFRPRQCVTNIIFSDE